MEEEEEEHRREEEVRRDGREWAVERRRRAEVWSSNFLIMFVNVLQLVSKTNQGDVAQMVERSLSMREVRGSIPRISIIFPKL